MKNRVTFLILSLLPALLMAEPLAKISITNPSEFDRVDDVVSIPLELVSVGNGSLESTQLVVFSDKILVPSQVIDTDSDGLTDTLLILTDLSAGEESIYKVKHSPKIALASAYTKRTQAELSQKVGGEWKDQVYEGGHFVNVQKIDTPPNHTDHSNFIRYEGPGIESDKVAYRFYLDWRNGFDIFGKTTNAMVLQNVGQDGFGSYHELSNWGMDILKVGPSLGIGGYGYWDGEKVICVSKTDDLIGSVSSNGAIHSSLRIEYPGWNYEAGKTDLTAELSMQAGSRVVMAHVTSTEDIENFCTGLVKHEGTEVIQGSTDITGEAWTYLATWGKQTLNGDNLGMAVLFKRNQFRQFASDEYNEVVVLRPRPNKVEYGIVAAWERETNGVSSKEEFISYLEEEVERLSRRPRVIIHSRDTIAETDKPLTPKAALKWSVKLAKGEMNRRGNSLHYNQYNPEKRSRANWSYTTGLESQSFSDIGTAADKPKLNEYAASIIDSFITDEGEILTYKESDYNIDEVNSGKMLLRLYQETGNEKFMIAAGHLREQLRKHPRTSEGGFWHKKRYPWQMWLDGLYMGPVFYAQYSILTDDEEGLADAIKQFVLIEKHTRNADTGLLNHAWDEKGVQGWADPETGKSHLYWARGLGWYSMALVDTLELLPSDHPGREQLTGILQRLAAGLVAFQDKKSGVWYQIMDQPERIGNYRESSGTAMFTYALAKGVNLGFLGEEYKKPALNAYQGMLDNFVRVHVDGSVSLDNICRVAGLGFGRDGSWKYYMTEHVCLNDPKGVGPFVMAGVQISNLLNSE